MSDLIDRAEAVMALRLEYPMMPFFKENRKEWAIKTEGYRKAEEVIMKLPSARPKGMTKEIHDINTRALDFVVELIDYIFDYPNDDYMTTECLCRKLLKHGLIDKVDGYYEPKDEQTEREGE